MSETISVPTLGQFLAVTWEGPFNDGGKCCYLLDASKIKLARDEAQFFGRKKPYWILHPKNTYDNQRFLANSEFAYDGIASGHHKWIKEEADCTLVLYEKIDKQP